MSYNRRRYTSSSSVIDTETIYDVDQQKLQSEINAEFQEGLDSKVDAEEGKGLSTNDYTTEEKSKLAGIEAQANKYVHPSQTSRTGKPTANQTPAFGGSFSVSQVKNDDQGHVTALTERTVTIPDTSATSTAKGLVVLSDDLTDTTPAATGGKAPSMKAVSDLNGALNGLDAYIRNKKIAIFGDSWSDEDIQWSTTINDVWVKTFRTLCSPYNATITNYSRSSRGWCIKDNNNQYNGAEIIANTSLTNIDTVIIEMGLNDFLNGIWVGAYNTTSTSLMWGALNSVTQYLTGKNVFVLTPALISSTGNRVCCATLELFRIVLANWAKQNGYMLINGTTCPQLGVGSSAYDGSHIKNAFHPIFAQHVFSKMLCGGEVFNPHNEILGFNPTSLGIATLTNATIHNLSVAYYIDRVSINVDLDITKENATASIVNAPLPVLSYFEPTYLTINYNNHPMRTSYTGSDLNTNPPKTAVYFADFSSGAYTGAARARWVGTAWSNCLGKPTM